MVRAYKRICAYCNTVGNVRRISTPMRNIEQQVRCSQWLARALSTDWEHLQIKYLLEIGIRGEDVNIVSLIPRATDRPRELV
jgi:hypothetical protein